MSFSDEVLKDVREKYKVQINAWVDQASMTELGKVPPFMLEVVPAWVPRFTAEQYLENLEKSTEELELSVRAYNCVKNARIGTVRVLVQKTEDELLRTKNFGRKPINELKEQLSYMGLRLGMSTHDLDELTKTK